MFAPVQSAFAAALLDPERPVPAGLSTHTAAPLNKRFAAYRNNVVVGLVNALGTRFPATQRIVGEEFFRAMARVFVTAHPPRSPLLMTYGDDFPDFIAGFPPTAEMPYLADVARLEAARTRAYHAADAAPLAPEEIACLKSDSLQGLRFLLHPSAQVVRSAHPIVTLWAMNSGERELGPVEDWRPEDALIARPRLEVEVRALPVGGAAFIVQLLAGQTLEEAATAALADAGDFDLARNLAGLIGAGLITGFAIEEPRKDLP